MKRGLALIWVLVICLSLCACGETNLVETNDVTDEHYITESSNATNEITENTVDATSASVDTTETTLNVNTELVDHFLSLLCGYWAVDDVPTYEGFPKSISIHSDKTAVLDETECAWEYGSMSDGEVNIRFLVEDEAISGRYFTLMLNEDGSVSVSLWGCSFSKVEN